MILKCAESKILRLFEKADDFLTSNDIAKELKVSKRTIIRY
ncbi:HTH domain-containing protein [Lentilactobacillus hilgardii]|nr:HTH domain-containing protein [Lentilactobacillus hilgardii]MCP9350903.1 HTH domain-containing protein [Lentilactobacillus hilgardii]MCP9353795.1 HTH domain-containing protein [Lentilactobacillus hilgardii]